VRRETPPSTPGTATPTTSASQGASPLPPQGLAQSLNTNDPQQAQMQEEYLRALLKGAPAQEGASGQGQPQSAGQEDPMMKVLGSLLGGVGEGGDPSALGGMNFSPDDISKVTGLPSFVTNMMMGSQKAPPTPAEEQSTRLWRILHLFFAIMAGIYLVFSVDRATTMFGENPPAPATFQNPFAIFLIGELLLQSARMMLAGSPGKRGLGLWWQMGKELARDGALSVFMLGTASWWGGSI
jgi:GET complex subunit GET2